LAAAVVVVVAAAKAASRRVFRLKLRLVAAQPAVTQSGSSLRFLGPLAFRIQAGGGSPKSVSKFAEHLSGISAWAENIRDDHRMFGRRNLEEKVVALPARKATSGPLPPTAVAAQASTRKSAHAAPPAEQPYELK
jgi:hypothetical protein